jgi:crotonobetainyl-CoA:carnitine CoA-transferase CaiB-like acyl-CoA transferase
MGPMFLNVNRNKRSIALDLKQPAGRDVLLRLAADADVFIYNVRPQAVARLGLAYEDVAAVNPAIIYTGVFGYGQDGPYAARPAYDDLIQGACAVPTLLADAGDGSPRYVPLTIADRIVGLFAVNAILAALRHRDATGRGQRIDVPMFETMANFVLIDHLGGLTFDPPLDHGGYARLLAPKRRPYRTKDGYLCALIYNDKQWRSFFAAIGRPGMQDERFRDHASRIRHIREIYAEVAEIFATRTTAEWMALLEEADIPYTPLRTVEGLLDDPHLAATGFFSHVEHPSEGTIKSMRTPTTWSDSKAESPRPAPVLGEHSLEILRELGLAEESIDALFAEGIAHGPQAAAPAKTDVV